MQLVLIGGVGIVLLWVGFYNGSFDVFDVGYVVFLGIEWVVEDGDVLQFSIIFGVMVLGGV